MDNHNIQSELATIRSLMERSTKFLSLSGLAGVLAGLYALTGGLLTHQLLEDGQQEVLVKKIALIAITVLILAISTGFLLTIRQANKNKETLWNPISKRLLLSIFIPLITGGIFILLLLRQEHFLLVAPSCLIFYGLALIAAGEYSFTAVKWMGGLDILLGILSLLFPQYGLYLWMAGFGLLHIIYGIRIYLNQNK